MKKIFLLSVLCCLSISVKAQFVHEPLNFPGVGYFTFYLNAVDSNSVWVGVNYISGSGAYLPYSNAVRTIDGGSNWQFYPLPDTGLVVIFDVAATDINTAYYVIYNGRTAIWKTMNGGSSWINMATTVFIGGFANFYHAFSADTGIAGGDPNNGYWELQRTYDGGNSWSRVPSSNIPVPLTNEYGLAHGFCAIGNSIWFVTTKGRCYRSVNQGLNWTVKQLPGTWVQPHVCFIDSLRGVAWDPNPYLKTQPTYNNYFLTTDGGLSWTQQSLAQNYAIQNFSRIPGVNGGMLISVIDSNNENLTTVLYTPDFLNTLAIIQTKIISSGQCNFLDNKTGWLAGDGFHNSSIYKFTGNLPVCVSETLEGKPQLQVCPNPSFAEAILKVPAAFNGTNGIIRILDITGKETYQKVITKSSSYNQLDAAKFINGIYIIQLITDDGASAVCRWVVCH